MDIATVLKPLSVSTRSAPAPISATFSPSPPPMIAALRYQLTPPKLPPLAVAICAASATPQFALAKIHKGTSLSSRVARRILQDDKNRKSRIVFDFPVEEMAQYYHLPQRVAAKRLGVAVITLKRNCKRRGIKWPYRSDKLREIQMTKAPKLQRYSCSARAPPVSSHHSSSKMSPMLLLSEAARAYSRLPVECMSDNVSKLVTSTTPSRC